MWTARPQLSLAAEQRSLERGRRRRGRRGRGKKNKPTTQKGFTRPTQHESSVFCGTCTPDTSPTHTVDVSSGLAVFSTPLQKRACLDPSEDP
ncbi:hypothetical protein JOB18_035560 [Solea senegalensis]|uniref:Uncharacterized protein n=1 Tax=Solea senegalensis TaxID=28829 RepID=A0AAV6S0H3_SOLSE|nr:hypothetical protein JOB18_035560 [Solea senegalensis]